MMKKKKKKFLEGYQVQKNCTLYNLEKNDIMKEGRTNFFFKIYKFKKFTLIFFANFFVPCAVAVASSVEIPLFLPVSRPPLPSPRLFNNSCLTFSQSPDSEPSTYNPLLSSSCPEY